MIACNFCGGKFCLEDHQKTNIPAILVEVLPLLDELPEFFPV